jgi:hypothetical protein
MIPFFPFLLGDLRLPSPELDPILDNNYPINIARLNSNSNCVSSSASRRTHGKHRLLLSRIVLGVFTDPLPSNRRPIFALVGSCGNVFTESLPSSGSIRHNIFTPVAVVFFIFLSDAL